MKILIVDDDRSARRALVRILVAMGDADLREAASLEEARREVAAGEIEVALIDLRLDEDGRNRDGLTLVSELRKHTNVVPIVVTASHDMAEVRTAMRLGAYDYIMKDELSDETVLPILQSLRSTRALEREVLNLRVRHGAEASAGLVGTSPAMQHLRDIIQRISLSERPALVTGPTGSGKEVVVRAIHALGRNPSEPLLDLNCAAFPAALIESQLFGHERGAFTGADRKHDGFFTAVGAGTLFLDEIAELPLDLQAKLLRVLEAHTYRPLGAANVLKFRGRVVAATHADLEERVAKGQFREDLWYRLNVLEVQVPSLEERRGDIPALVAHFAASQERPLQFTAEAMEILQMAQWPGNVRQLRNFVDRLAVFCPESLVSAESLSTVPQASRSRKSAPPLESVRSPLSELARAVLKMSDEEGDKLALMEQVLIQEALVLADGNKTAAARLLGVHRKVVARRADREGDGDPTAGDASAPSPRAADDLLSRRLKD